MNRIQLSHISRALTLLIVLSLLFLLTYLILLVFILYSGLKLVVKIGVFMLLLAIMFVAVNIATERYLKLRLGQEK
jgi:hypothetical protein